MSLSKSFRRALLVTLFALCLGAPAQATAATTINITPSADPVEDVVHQLTFSGNSDASRGLYVRIKPVGGQACGPTRSADSGGNDIIGGRNVNGSYSEVVNYEAEDSGDYLVCAWILNGSGATTADAASSRTVTVRAPRSTVTVQVPASVAADSPFQASVVAQTEVFRSLYLDLNAPGVPCGANRDANSGLQTVLSGQSNEGGPTTHTRNVTAPRAAGRYTLCGWVQEGSGDTSPEAVFSAPLQVTPSVACQGAIAGADRAARAVTKYTKLYKKYKKLAARSRGAKRRRYVKKARQAKRRLSAARNSAASWTNRVANECS